MASSLPLESLPLLRHLPNVTIRHLELHGAIRSLNRRQVALQRDERPKALYFLLEGRLQGMDFTSDGREVGLYFVNPGDYFGEIALIDMQGQPEHVVAIARSKIFDIPYHLIRPLLFSSPKMAEELCQRLARRTRQDVIQRKILALTNPTQRVCAQLDILRERGGNRITNIPTHQDLAMMLNISRETVTRVFQVLQGRNIVERDGPDLLVNRLDLLTSIARGIIDPTKQGIEL